MIKYHLSNAQKKEIANGKRLRIALPYPDEGITGAHIHHDLTGTAPEQALLRWAESVLRGCDVSPEMIAVAELVLVPILPGEHPGGSLGEILGCVANRGGRWVIRILCVAVEIDKGHGVRGYYPTQWPTAVTIDGMRYPREPQAVT